MREILLPQPLWRWAGFDVVKPEGADAEIPVVESVCLILKPEIL